MNCQKCYNKAATQKVCIDYGRDIDWENWCDDCVNKELTLLKEKYATGELSFNEYEEEVDWLLGGPRPRITEEPTYATTPGRLSQEDYDCLR